MHSRGEISHTQDIMSHLTHLQEDHLSIGAQREGMSSEIQEPLQGFERTLAQKRRDIRSQNKGSEHTLNAGRPYRNISRMTNVSSSAIPEFKRCVGLSGGHRGKTAAHKKFIVVA